MSAFLDTTFKVRTREVNHLGRLKLSAVADYLQEAAALHTTQMGIGPFQLNRRDWFWVLSRLRIDMVCYPQWNDEVRVKTWPKGERQLVASRDFLLCGENNTVFGSATSQWLLLDRKTQRPLKLEALPGGFVIDHTIAAAIAEPPVKVPRPTRIDHEIAREPYFSDIDLNSHLNNTRYIDWALDALPPERRDRRIVSLTVNYLSEIKYGELTAVCRTDVSPTTADIEGIIRPDGPTAFRARIVFDANSETIAP